MHEHSFSSIILELFLDCHCVWLSCVGLSLSSWISTCLLIPSIRMASNIFSLTLRTRLGFPHPMAHGLSRCMWLGHRFDKDTLTSLCSWGRGHGHTWCSLRFFCRHCQGCQVPCFARTKTCSPNTIFLIIMVMSGYCAYIKWYSHFGQCSHCWSNLWGSCFVSRFFPKSGDNDCSLCKGHTILQLTPWIWFHPSNSKNIWIFTPASKWFPS